MAASTVSKRQVQVGLIPLLISYAGFVVLGMPDGILGMAWPSMQTTFSVPLDAMGLLLLPGTVAYMLSSALSGRLIGSYGIGAFLLVGAAVRGLGFLGVAIAPSWGLLLAVLFVAGLGTGVIDSGMNTFVATNYSAGRLSWLHACFGLGATFSPSDHDRDPGQQRAVAGWLRPGGRDSARHGGRDRAHLRPLAHQHPPG